MRFETGRCGNCGLPVRVPGYGFMAIGNSCPHCGCVFAWASEGGETREEKNIKAAYAAGVEKGKELAAAEKGDGEAT